MDDGRSRERLSFPGRPLPGWFEVRVVVVAPGRERAFDDAEWRDALIVVERGEIELECLGGTCWRCGRGDVLWFIGLPVCTLHHPRREPPCWPSRGGDEATPRSLVNAAL
jgi:hypothetical protein